MSTLAIVAEYNPFHFGHEYHIKKSKEITGSNGVIVIMSGSFVQRGEPAFMDKWTRSKIAINSGADLVIELPTLYATQSAEFFAYGSVKLLNELNIVDYISFGSELGDVNNLNVIAKILNKEPDKYKYYLKENLDCGLSFPKSRENAIIKYIKYNTDLNINKFTNILNKPNNILSIEYIKALNKLQSKITPITIPRKGSGYNDSTVSSDFLSATAIRKLILTNNPFYKESIPINAYHSIEEYKSKFKIFNNIENYKDILNYIINTSSIEYLNEFMDMEDGLANRFKKVFQENLSVSESISKISTKRYTRTRIQRIIIHILLDLKKKDFLQLSKIYPNYVRVLGANSKGLELISDIKANSKLEIITKFANIKDPEIEKISKLDKLATDLFSIATQNKINLDYYISPYIKKG